MKHAGAMSLIREQPRTTIVMFSAAVLGWLLLTWAVVDMSHPLAQLMMPVDPAWSATNIVAVVLMWSTMMMAMMLPSAAPMILTFANLAARKRQSYLSWTFASAYLVMWTVFSVMATALQWSLQVTGLITPMMVSRSAWLTGALLLVAGVVQFTPLKDVCLRHCRTPMGYLLTEWRDGILGAWRMGLKHGLYCLGCCWALMGLLFVAGVMNLAWVAALSAAVIVEKVHPAGIGIGKFLGGILIVAGMARLISQI